MLANNSCKRVCLNSCCTLQFIRSISVTARTEDRWLCKSSYYKRQFFLKLEWKFTHLFFETFTRLMLFCYIFIFLLALFFFEKLKKMTWQTPVWPEIRLTKTVILNKASPAKLTYTSPHFYTKFLIILHI